MLDEERHGILYSHPYVLDNVLVGQTPEVLRADGTTG